MSWFSNLFEGGRLVSDLSVWLNLPVNELIIWKSGIPETFGYTQFQVPKKNGIDYRVISAPDQNLKKLQKTIYHRLLKPIPCHVASTGFIPKKSIVHNAKQHISSEVIINIDLKDFFISTKNQRVYDYFKRLGWGRTSARILTNICCFQGGLPQGAAALYTLERVTVLTPNIHYE